MKDKHYHYIVSYFRQIFPLGIWDFHQNIDIYFVKLNSVSRISEAEKTLKTNNDERIIITGIIQLECDCDE